MGLTEEMAAAFEGSAPSTETPATIVTQSEVTTADTDTAPAASSDLTSTEVDTNTEDPQGAEPEKAEEAKEGNAHKRLRNRAQKAERELAYYKGLVEGRGITQEPASFSNDTRTAPNTPNQYTQAAQPNQPQRPEISQFMDSEGMVDFDAFEAAKEQYILDAAEFRAEAKLKAAQEASTTQQRVAEIQRNFELKVKEAAKRDPEILDIAENPDFLDEYHPFTQTLALELLQSGPAMLRHLHDNPDTVDQLYAAQNVNSMLRMYGKLEAKLESLKPAPVKTVSAAPKPIKTVESNAALDVPLEEVGSMEEFARRFEKSYLHKGR